LTTALAAACGRPACQQHVACIEIVPRPIGAAVARRFTGGKLIGRPDEFVGDVQLVVTELVTNAYEAICRASAPCAPDLHEMIRLSVQCAPRWVHLRVTDPIPDIPTRKKPADTDERGRGLAVVDEYAFWWVHPRPAGKTIHAVMPAPDAVLTQADFDRIASDL
jgi:hypothetical protein